MSTYSLVLFCLLLGYCLQKMLPFRPGLLHLLNAYIIRVALPALIIGTIPDLQFSYDALFSVLMPWMLVGLSFLLIYPLASAMSWSQEIKIATVLLLGLGNTAFIGLPLIKAFLGDESLSIAIIYDQIGSFLVLSIVATSVIAMHGGQGDAPLSRNVIKKILSFPPFISLLVALCIPSTDSLDGLIVVTEFLGATILPLAMLMVGLQFSMRIQREFKMPMLVVMIGKMIVSPLLVWLLGALIGIDWKILQASIMQAAMPPMITPAILLIGAGIAPRYVATALGFSTLAACLTLPVFFYWVGGG